MNTLYESSPSPTLDAWHTLWSEPTDAETTAFASYFEDASSENATMHLGADNLALVAVEAPGKGKCSIFFALFYFDLSFPEAWICMWSRRK